MLPAFLHSCSVALATTLLVRRSQEHQTTLVAQDLTVRLPGGRVLLDRVSFPVGERSVVAVIGPSGAGKTTLLRALTGMAPATEGAVLYDNRDLYAHYAELRHRIGLVPQEDVIYPHLTPRRALGYPAPTPTCQWRGRCP